MDYEQFFEEATGFSPYPYQARLGDEISLPVLLDVPTGMGKTAAIVLAWMYRVWCRRSGTPNRLIYCLPMRTIVEQTEQAASRWVDEGLRGHFEDEGLVPPSVNVLMGGTQDMEWVDRPEDPAIIIGTQEMLLSRALMRGYGMSRFSWPIHYALMNNDSLWVFDETQLMGVAVETSAQLQGLRSILGTAKPTKSVWMSATLGQAQLNTIDHPRPDDGWPTLTISDDDRARESARKRLEATKRVELLQDAEIGKKTHTKRGLKTYIESLTQAIMTAHEEDTLTLIVLNNVRRAQLVYEQLIQSHGRTAENTALIHSRYRPHDRRHNESLLEDESGDRIIVATQAIEAGVDISSMVLITELADWSSMVQRFGRNNRAGEYERSRVLWVDILEEAKEHLMLPYTLEGLERARRRLKGLKEVGPLVLESLPPVQEQRDVRPILRRKDLKELFDTTPDLSGDDLDVSRYIRDAEDNDVQVFWRNWEEPDRPPSPTLARPQREELCRVSVRSFDEFVKTKKVTVWRWDHLGNEEHSKGCWVRARRFYPGLTVLLHCESGGYNAEIGWNGEQGESVEEVPHAQNAHEGMNSNDSTTTGVWVPLSDHLEHVARETADVAQALGVRAPQKKALVDAARWHDVGKAHEAFQAMLKEPVRRGDVLPGEGYTIEDIEDGIWAKSNHRQGHPSRRYFRHEVASAIAYLQYADDDLVAYLIAAHHGKVRLSLRPLPQEVSEKEEHSEIGLFTRGVRHGDHLPEVEIPSDGEHSFEPLDLGLMRLGQGSWLERTLALRDDDALGPFRLAWLEMVLRIADWRASAKESPKEEQ